MAILLNLELCYNLIYFIWNTIQFARLKIELIIIIFEKKVKKSFSGLKGHAHRKWKKIAFQLKKRKRESKGEKGKKSNGHKNMTGEKKIYSKT